MYFPERVIDSLRPCPDCSDRFWRYPDASKANKHSTVRVTCNSCGKFLGYYHVKFGDPLHAAEKRRMKEQTKGWD